MRQTEAQQARILLNGDHPELTLLAMQAWSNACMLNAVLRACQHDVLAWINSRYHFALILLSCGLV